jgi:hypothetical protein
MKAPLIAYKCKSCGAVSEDDAENFKALHTMPPTWANTCAFCKGTVVCSPQALLSKEVNENFDDYSTYLSSRLS